MPLLKIFKSDFGTIRVSRGPKDTLAYYQNGCFHSQATRNGTSVCAYIHIIHEIIRQRRARNVLIIGCAGGTLATMLRRLNRKVTVVDIDPMAFTIAHTYFKLPHDVRCIRQDGIVYLRQAKKEFDAIVIDVFGSDNAVPKAFTEKRFFDLVKNSLSPAGVMIMNTISRNDEDRRSDAVARQAQRVLENITLFDWPREKDRNTLIVSGITRRTHIPSGKEPKWMREDFCGLVRRKARLNQQF